MAGNSKFSNQFKSFGKNTLGGVGQSTSPGLTAADLNGVKEAIGNSVDVQVESLDTQKAGLDEVRDLKKVLGQQLGDINESVKAGTEQSIKNTDRVETVIKRGFGIDEYQYLKDEQAAKAAQASGGGGPSLGAVSGAAGAASKAGGLLAGGIGRIMRLGKGLLGKLALPLLALTAVFDAFEGSSKEAATKLFGDGSMWNRVKSGFMHVMSGLTIGLVSPERMAAIIGPVMDLYKKTALRFTSAITGVAEKFMGQVSGVIDSALGIFNKAKEAISKPLAVFTSKIEEFYDSDLLKPVKGFIDKTKNKVNEALEGIQNFMGDLWTGFKEKLGDFVPDVFKEIAQDVKDTAGKVKHGITASSEELGVGGVTPTSGSGVAGSQGGPGDYSNLGSVAHSFETGKSTGDAGMISTGKGDYGGKSYGSNQLSTTTGTLQDYLRNSKYGSEFSGLTPGSAEFDAKWKEIAARDPDFGNDQNDYIRRTHYGAAQSALAKKGVDLSGRSRGMEEMIYSTANQFGAAGGSSLIKKAMDQAGLDSSASDEEIIKAVQQYKRDNNDTLFKSSSQNVRDGVYARTKTEEKKLLELAGVKGSGEKAGDVPAHERATGTAEQQVASRSASGEDSGDGLLGTMKGALASLEALAASAEPFTPDSASGLDSSIKSEKAERDALLAQAQPAEDTTGGGMIGLDSIPMLPADQGMLAMNMGMMG